MLDFDQNPPRLDLNMNDKEKLRTDRTEDVKKVGFVIKILWIFVVVLFYNIAFA